MRRVRCVCRSLLLRTGNLLLKLIRVSSYHCNCLSNNPPNLHNFFNFLNFICSVHGMSCHIVQLIVVSSFEGSNELNCAVTTINNFNTCSNTWSSDLELVLKCTLWCRYHLCWRWLETIYVQKINIFGATENGKVFNVLATYMYLVSNLLMTTSSRSVAD